ncbi:MAG: metal ABC transporter permease [Formivibrio sp.]|nr:metal ABC transporter permease [Formivibrio sp.]
MTLNEIIISPFTDFSFMRRALAGCVALATGCAPIGVLLVLRRMSLMGDALSHAVLPGAAIGFILGGFALPWLAGGGVVAGLLVAILAGLASRFTDLSEDANFAGFYLVALALGVLLVSKWGSNVDLIHLLFGSVLAVDDVSLLLVTAISGFTLAWLALNYRGLVLECVDPGYLQASGARGTRFHLGFVALTVLNLVAGFQAMGTLMAVGLMMLPAATSRLWTDTLPGMIFAAWITGLIASLVGLMLSYHFSLPSGPAIVLVAGLCYLISLLMAPRGWHGRWRARRHLEQ